MPRRTHFLFALGLACGLTAGMAAAQDTPLAWLAGDADVVIRIAAPDQAVDKMAELVQKVQPGLGDLVTDNADQIGRYISNPTMTSVDRSRPWYVCFLSRGEEPPQAVFAIPAVSAQDFVGALDAGMKSEIHDRWVIYTNGEQLPQPAATASLETQLSPAARAALEAGDAGVYVNMAHLATAYAQQLDALHEQSLQLLTNLRYVPQQQGVDVNAVADLYGYIFDGVFQAIKDADYTVVSVQLQEGNVAIDHIIKFRAETPSSQLLMDNPAISFSNLGKLPAGLDGYVAFGGLSKGILKSVLEAATGVYGDPEQREKMQASVAKMLELDYGENVGGIRLDALEEGPMLAIYGASKVAPMDQYKALTRESLENQNIEIAGLTQTVELQPDAEEYGDLKVDLAIIRQEFTNAVPGTAEMQERIQELMFGSAPQVRYAYLPDAALTTTGGGRENMEALLRAYRSAQLSDVPKYAVPLMDKANLVVHMDLVQMAGKSVYRAARDQLVPIRLTAQMLDNLNLRRSYAGYALGSEGGVLKSQVRVPIEQIQGFTRLGILLGGASQGF